MTEIKGDMASAEDIWSGITSVGVDFGAGAESCIGGKGLLVQDRRMLQIFGWVPCRFGIFGSISTSFEDVDAPDWSPGEDMPC